MGDGIFRGMQRIPDSTLFHPGYADCNINVRKRLNFKGILLRHLRQSVIFKVQLKDENEPRMKRMSKQIIVGIVAVLCLIALPLQAQAKPAKAKTNQEATKERLVLMPLRLSEEDKNLQGAMETALVKGLQQKYEVFSGEQVAKKAREIFLKESRNTTHKE